MSPHGNGNVGIKTASPAELLDIAASADNSATAGPKINFKKGLAYAFKNMGLGHYTKGDFSDVLIHWEQSLAIFEEINETLVPRQIGGIIKRTLDISGTTITNGLTATKYDLQQEQQTQSGEMQLLKTATTAPQS